jgi:hypothetical protein
VDPRGQRRGERERSRGPPEWPHMPGTCSRGLGRALTNDSREVLLPSFPPLSLSLPAPVEEEIWGPEIRSRTTEEIHPSSSPPPIAIQVLSPCPVLCGKRSGPRGSDSKTPSPRWIPRRFGRRAPNLVRNHSLTPFSQTICNGDFSLIAALLQVQ